MLEIEREMIRIRGKEFKKLQRESEKIERNRAKNAEIETEIIIETEKEREKSWIWRETD